MKRMGLWRVLCAFALCILLSACGKQPSVTPNGEKPGDGEVTPSGAAEENETKYGEMRELTTQDIVLDMGIGINLGNTMEATGGTGITSVYGYETLWGSPMITPNIIAGYKKAGFDSMRIPVAWSNLMSEDYTISEDLMNRVQAIVNCVLENEMYAIVNIHWDGGWWENFPTDYDECMKKYTRIWEQISERFRDYGDMLILESLNEEGCFDSVWNRYGGSTARKQEAFDILNDINQKFVDIVRGSGGNNAKRHLLIAGYATDVELTCDPCFRMPNDTAGRCAVSVHYYTPSTFCILSADADWGKADPDWGTDADVALLERNMDKLKTTFVDKGVPVIIGEYGVAKGNKTEEMVRLYITTVAREAYERGMCPMLWDTTGSHYNRTLAKMLDAEMEAELKGIAAEGRR